MDGTGSVRNRQVNACGHVENRRRNPGMGWSFVRGDGIVLACSVKKKGGQRGVLTGGPHGQRDGGMFGPSDSLAHMFGPSK